MTWGMETITKPDEVVSYRVSLAIQTCDGGHAVWLAKWCDEMPSSRHERFGIHHDVLGDEVATRGKTC